jgi:hypothetical protein
MMNHLSPITGSVAMPLTTLEANTIARAITAAKRVLDEFKPAIDQLNIIYDSAGGAKVTITQAKLDEAGNLSGLTKAQLDDALYVLTNNVRLALDAAAVTALAHLAARG